MPVLGHKRCAPAVLMSLVHHVARFRSSVEGYDCSAVWNLRHAKECSGEAKFCAGMTEQFPRARSTMMLERDDFSLGKVIERLKIPFEPVLLAEEV